MFVFHMAATLSLIAISFGTSMYIWGTRTAGKGTGLARIMGFIIMLLAIINFLCTVFFGYMAMGYMPGGMGKGMMMGDNPMCHCTQQAGANNAAGQMGQKSATTPSQTTTQPTQQESQY